MGWRACSVLGSQERTAVRETLVGRWCAPTRTDLSTWLEWSAGVEAVEVTLVLEYIQRCPTSLNGWKKTSNKTNNNSATSHKLKIMKNSFQMNKRAAVVTLYFVLIQDMFVIMLSANQRIKIY